MSEPEVGHKDVLGKPRWSLFPWDAAEEVVRVLMFGAGKYAPDNWRKVENGKELYFEAMIRHAVRHRQGEVYDAESGLRHTAHLACDALFVLAFELAGK
jgi:hypothetical protein